MASLKAAPYSILGRYDTTSASYPAAWKVWLGKTFSNAVKFGSAP